MWLKEFLLILINEYYFWIIFEVVGILILNLIHFLFDSVTKFLKFCVLRGFYVTTIYLTVKSFYDSMKFLKLFIYKSASLVFSSSKLLYAINQLKFFIYLSYHVELNYNRTCSFCFFLFFVILMIFKFVSVFFYTLFAVYFWTANKFNLWFCIIFFSVYFVDWTKHMRSVANFT